MNKQRVSVTERQLYANCNAIHIIIYSNSLVIFTHENFPIYGILYIYNTQLKTKPTIISLENKMFNQKLYA